MENNPLKEIQQNERTQYNNPLKEIQQNKRTQYRQLNGIRKTAFVDGWMDGWMDGGQACNQREMLFCGKATPQEDTQISEKARAEKYPAGHLV